MTLADHTNRAQLRVLESVPAPVIPLREPTVDEEMCREAAFRLRGMADEMASGVAASLRTAADLVEHGHTDRAVRAARKLLNRDLSTPGGAA